MSEWKQFLPSDFGSSEPEPLPPLLTNKDADMLECEKTSVFQFRIRTPLLMNEERRNEMKDHFYFNPHHFLRKRLVSKWVTPNEMHRDTHILVANGWLRDTLQRDELFWDRRNADTTRIVTQLMKTDPTYTLLSGRVRHENEYWFERDMNADSLAIIGYHASQGITPLTCALLCPYSVGLDYRRERSKHFKSDADSLQTRAPARTILGAGLATSAGESKVCDSSLLGDVPAKSLSSQPQLPELVKDERGAAIHQPKRAGPPCTLR